jgi:hypothetical protein
MKKQNRLIQCVCCAIIIFFVCGALAPMCSAQINPPQGNRVKTSQDKVTHADVNNQTFFDFAIIWGPFEVRWWVSPFLNLVVYNRAPWWNKTMNVIGYLIPEHQWFFKKSYWIECGYLHIGFVGRHWLFVIGYGNIAAFG